MSKKNLQIILLFITITALFYWKLIFKNLVLFPGDLLVGAYFPWLDYKWGYAVGVPVKNPLISDIFSQFHTWKSLIAESLRAGNWPLWNPYSYAGYPLLANFNSGALNPFNLLMVFFGKATGWNLMIISQTLGSLLAFYLYLTTMKLSKQASIVGALTYAFSGFAITWLPFLNVGFSFIWMALILWAIETFFQTKKYKYLLFISPLLLLFTLAGHFQALVFGCLMFGTYFVYRGLVELGFKKMITPSLAFLISIVLGGFMTAVQMLPTLELMPRTVRFVEGYIADFGYGLLPKTHILTFLVPDFFGNASTNNYWSVFNYHETVVYLGVFAVLSFIGSLYYFKKLGKFKFYFFWLLVSCLFIFNTVFGRAVYEYNLPLVSTSAAGRISFLIVISASAISAWWYDRLRKMKFFEILRLYWWLPLTYITIFLISFFIYKKYLPHAQVIPLELQKARIAWRNVIFPFGVSTLFLFVILFFRKTKVFFVLIVLVIMLDMFRFGWKYLPFVSKGFIYPDTPVTEYLKNQPGIFRIDREKAQVLPPNTWEAYRLSSASGYDPMAVREYVGYYNRFLNGLDADYASRYSELSRYDARTLGELNVRYFLALNRDEEGEVDENGTSFRKKIIRDDWEEVFRDKTVSVLANKYYKERAQIIGSEGKVTITSYQPERVVIDYSLDTDGQLVLMDTFYPGWHAYLDGRELEISRHMEVFRKVDVPKGEGKVVFVYHPKSFYWGLRISLLSFLIWLVIYKYVQE